MLNVKSHGVRAVMTFHLFIENVLWAETQRAEVPRRMGAACALFLGSLHSVVRFIVAPLLIDKCMSR